MEQLRQGLFEVAHEAECPDESLGFEEATWIEPSKQRFEIESLVLLPPNRQLMVAAFSRSPWSAHDHDHVRSEQGPMPKH